MPLSHALLGLINYRPSNGYELKDMFKKSIHFFWNATLPQIYRTLARMEAAGWVRSSMDHRDGKPSRRIYAITDAGKEELRGWLALPPDVSSPREAMMIKVFFASEMDIDTFIRQVRQWRDHHAAVLKKFRQDVAPMIEEKGRTKALAASAPYWRLTLDFGIRKTEAAVEWCDETLKWAQRQKKKGTR
jgi:DNA-binding PadR family transcriptional regulator